MTSSRAESLAPPRGGTPPAERVALGGAGVVPIRPLAEEVARRHFAEFPDELDRYGAAGFEWCVHDTQYLVAWAASDLAGSLRAQVQWLARVLGARGYPVERLRRTLELAADVVRETHPDAAQVARALESAAKLV